MEVTSLFPVHGTSEWWSPSHRTQCLEASISTWLHRQPWPWPLGHVAVCALWGIHSQAEKQSRAVGQDLGCSRIFWNRPGQHIHLWSPVTEPASWALPACWAPSWERHTLLAPQYMQPVPPAGRRMGSRKPCLHSQGSTSTSGLCREPQLRLGSTVPHHTACIRRNCTTVLE